MSGQSGIGETITSPYFPFWSYYGYFDLGPVQIPPLTKTFGLTDRATGKVLYLQYDSQASGAPGSPLGRLVLQNLLAGPNLANSQIFGPWDGPYFFGYGWPLRLGLDNGRLVWDLFQAGSRYADHNSPIWARDINNTSMVYYLQMASGYANVNQGNRLSFAQLVKATPQTTPASGGTP